MSPLRLVLPVVLSFVLPVWLAACDRAEKQAPTTTAPAPAPKPAPMPPPAQAPAAAPFAVSAVKVGNAIGADKRVSAPSQTLAPTDTIYASVDTTGAAPKVVLTARWLYEDGQLVNEQSQTIAPTGPAVTEFHIAKPDGWPTGTYKVEILADGSSVATQQFEVQ